MAKEPQRPLLRRRLLVWVFSYIALISVILIVSSFVLYENAERTAWHSQLNAEMQRHLQRSAGDIGYQWRDGNDLRLFQWKDATPPGDVAKLSPGLHEDVWVEGRLCVVLVEDTVQGRLALALDITQFDVLETTLGLRALLILLLLVLVLGGLLAVVIGRVVRPLTEMASDIAHLQPERSGQRLELPAGSSKEQEIIAEAFNDFLKRNDRFVERERTFINMASHELRTPIAGISGAAQLAASQPELPAIAQEQLQRVQRSASQMEQLVQLLLVLAKDPKRLMATADPVALHELLPEIVDDHRYLTRHKQLQLQLNISASCNIQAPLPILQAAIGNLLRNAIEHSDGGTIRISLNSDASVTIADPGHGMSPEEIARIYARLVRGEARDGGGIGLDLIARLCEHLGWQLEIDGVDEGGTVARLRFKPSDLANDGLH